MLETMSDLDLQNVVRLLEIAGILKQIQSEVLNLDVDGRKQMELITRLWDVRFLRDMSIWAMLSFINVRSKIIRNTYNNK